MSLNRVFRPESDKLSGKLLEYSAKVGAADHLPDHQQAFKKFLSEDFRHHDEWYIEWEVATGKIVWSYGFDTWLGHPKLKDGLNCYAALGKYVHPFISDWYIAYLKAIAVYFSEIEARYLQTRCNITVPIRTQSGDYYLIKHMIIPFSMTHKYKVITLMNAFSICGPYIGEPMRIQFMEGNKPIEHDVVSTLIEYLRSSMEITDSPKGRTLYEADWVYIDSIIKKRDVEKLDYKNIASGLQARDLKVPEKGAMKKRIQRLPTRLQWLLGIDLKPPSVCLQGKNKDFLPEYKKILQLLDFMDQSGILPLLRSYYEAKRLKKD